MFKRMSVVFCSAALALMTAGYASAQSATQEAKDKTKAAADKTGDVITDASITSAVKSKLLASKAVGGLKIDVDTTEGVVTLNGTAHSSAERNEAVRLAKTIKGVKSVKSNLVLDTAATTGRTDKDDKLKVEVKDDTKETGEKIKDGSKKAADKTVDATKKGAEKTKQGAEKAGEATKDAAVKSKDVTADAAITSAVKTKFLGDTKVAGLKIDVDTKDNVVTLTGNVKSEAEKAEAIRLAKNTTGVKSVVDKLTVIR
jgi:hyperosmotically inducible periplasmic protein